MAALGGFLSAGSGSRTVVVTSQTDNVKIGKNAGSLFSGDDDDNIAIGTNALNSTGTNCDNNVAIGKNALTALTTGDNNIVIGEESGAALTTSSNNIAIGKDTLKVADTNAAENIIIGHESGNNLDDGDYNILIGTGSGQGAITEDNNIAIGKNALNALSSGADNICIGQLAGEDLSTSTRNIAIGKHAMKNTTTGANENVCIGAEAGTNVSTGDKNIIIGSDTAQGALTTNNNIFMGSSTGAACTNDSENIVMGTFSMYGSTGTGRTKNVVLGYAASASGSVDHGIAIGPSAGCGTLADAEYTISIGNNAGQDITSGNGNFSLGGGANMEQTTGDGNIAVGPGALQLGNHSDGAGFNVGLGRDAGQYISTGEGNIAIGYESLTGLNASKITGDGNIGIGYQSLTAAITTCTRNTAIGYQSGNTITTGTDNVLLGYQTDVAATDTGQVRIGSYGGLKYYCNRFTLSTFTNAGTDNRAATGPLFKIPQYGFLKSVTCTVITASGGTGVYNISLGTAVEAAGDAVAGQVEIIGAGASDLTGCVSRTQAADAAGDTNVDISTVKQLHIFEADLTKADNNGAWMANDMYLYVCHAGTGNGTNATNAVVEITAQWWGED